MPISTVTVSTPPVSPEDESRQVVAVGAVVTASEPHDVPRGSRYEAWPSRFCNGTIAVPWLCSSNTVHCERDDASLDS